MTEHTIDDNAYNKMRFDIFELSDTISEELYDSTTMKYVKCHICKNDKFSHEKKLGSFDISKCLKCNTRSVNPRPIESTLKTFYDLFYEQIPFIKNFGINHTMGYKSDAGNKNKKIVDMIKTNFTVDEEIKILEIGCNRPNKNKLLQLSNELCDYEKRKIYGIDLSDIEKYYDKELYNKHKVYISGNTTLENLSESDFDIVIMYDVIEHVYDVTVLMDQIKKKLRGENSMLMFSIPNKNSLSYILDHDEQKCIILNTLVPMQHLNEFSLKNMGLFAYLNGFKILTLDCPGSLDVQSIAGLELTDLNDPHNPNDQNSRDLVEIRKLFAKLNDQDKLLMQKCINMTKTSTYVEVYMALL